ncbi:MAG: IS66 family transposase [Actinobacteria bacterium]|nr:IS66 family transposase [Actinomycetota bacterium]MCA1698601.1 IS66 family transposase [Actinomycetota bacterium]
MELRREDAERVAVAGGEPARELLLALFDRVGEQGEQLAAQAQRLEKLERRLGQNSQNSSLPPSKDPPQAPKRPPRKRSGRKQGAQHGHKGVSRELIDDPDETFEHRPDRCRKCGRELTGEERVVGRPVRHQVIELPDSVVTTTEHRLVKVCCADCGTHTRAELGAGVERGAFGPRLRATVVMLAVMLMSRRATLVLLRDMFGARISLGSVDNILKSASELLAAPWEAIKHAVQAADVAHADETSWARAGQRLWLWSALSATAACYRIDPTRARPAAKQLLGDFDGLLISDRYGVYDFIDPRKRQVCLGHLARNFQAFAERPGAPGRHGQQIRALIDEVIRADTQARRDDRTLDWSSGPLHDIHDRLMDAVEAGERSHTPDLARLCATILDIWPTLWNFTEHPDAQATNNRAERALRHAVLWRKTSNGTQTDAGERFVERVLSIRETCRLNNKPLHDYLIDIHTARLTGQPIPTPLPATKQAA